MMRLELSCVTNMLKNEKQDSYEKDRKKAEKKAQCDKIEGLRAAIS